MKVEQKKITLNHTKVRLTEEEVEKYKSQQQLTEGDCGNWFIEISGGGIHTCRICYSGYPTSWPYKQCIELPEDE